MSPRVLPLVLALFWAVIPPKAAAAEKPCQDLNGNPIRCPGAVGEFPKGKLNTDVPGESQSLPSGASGVTGMASGGVSAAAKIAYGVQSQNGTTTDDAGDAGKTTSSGKNGRPSEGIGTADRVPTADFIQGAGEFAGQFKGKDRRLAQLSVNAIVAEVRKVDPETTSAQNLETLKLYTRNEIDEKAQIRAARRQYRGEELKAKIAEIEAASADRAAAFPKGLVADLFPTKFNEAWDVVRQEFRDRHEYGNGLPSRRRLNDLLRDGGGNAANLTLDAQDKLASGDKAGGRAALDKAISAGGSAEAFALRGALRLDDKDYDGAYQDAKQALGLNSGDKNAMGVLKSAEGRASPRLTSAPSLGAGSGSAGSGAAGGSFRNAGTGGLSGFGAPRTREIPGMTAASTLASNQKLDEARRALAMNDAGAAIALAKRALELNPNNAEAYAFMSGVYARSGDFKNAIASANAGLALAPRDAALLNSKAFAENRLKLYREALGTSTGAIEADSRNALSYANRAHAYGGLGDKESMMSDINRAAGIDPRFEKAAADAAALQLPSNADILFMFPGENPSEPAAPAPARGKSFGLVVGAGIAGGLLLALGLLSTVLAPIKDSVVSAFTKATRRGPAVHALEEESTPEAPAEPAAPGLIRGQYEISRQIGAGGMGMVYEGTDRSLGRRVAIKKMRDELRMNPRERERFVIEAKTVASLHHPNIVDIFAIAEEGDDVYLVFEFVDGRTIHDLVQAKGRLNRADSLLVTRAIADALAYAHSRGVIHRDMKPSNVMVTGDGRIKVMDFGIARMAKDALTRYSMTNTVVGTPPYMAPEQEQGVVRKESDVYSLGICAYEMLTGKLPFIGIGAGMLMNKINMSYVPPSRAIAGLPETLDEVFLKAFQADPDQRYHTPQEFAKALASAFGEVPGRI